MEGEITGASVGDPGVVLKPESVRGEAAGVLGKDSNSLSKSRYGHELRAVVVKER